MNSKNISAASVLIARQLNLRRLLRTQRRRERGFTLLEALVALVMFVFITGATGFALTGALRSQQAVRERAEEIQESRNLFNIVSRDLRSAYISTGNPNTYFVGSSDQSSQMPLSFTALIHRIQYDPNSANSTNSGNQTDVQPQSDLSTVTYYFDSNSNELSRSESAIPAADTQSQGAPPQDQSNRQTLSRRIKSITLQFYDSGIAPPVAPAATTGATGGTSTATQSAQTTTSTQSGWNSQWSYTSNTNSQSATTTQQNNLNLPSAVQISIELISNSGRTRTYETTVAIPAFQPQPKGQAPAAAVAAAGGRSLFLGNDGDNDGADSGIEIRPRSIRPRSIQPGALPGLSGTGPVRF